MAAKDRTEPTALDVLKALAVQIKFISPEQLVRGWFADLGDALAQATQVLDYLRVQRLVERATIEIRSARPATEPVFTWRPGERDPSPRRLEDLAAHFAMRWTERFASVEVFRASRFAANLFGIRDTGVGRACEWSHDFRLTEVYLRYRRVSPEAVSHWQGESARLKWGKQVARMKDPDAMLLGPGGEIQRVIEVAGKYSTEHLADLHRHCAGGAYERIEAWQQGRGEALSRNPYSLVEIAYELW